MYGITGPLKKKNYGLLLCQISAKYIFEAQTLKIFSLIFKILNQSYIYIYI